MKFLFRIAAAAVLCLVLVTGAASAAGSVTLSLINPLYAGADPWVYYRDGKYYLLTTAVTRVTIRQADTLAGLKTAREKQVWAPPANQAYSKNLWAPELHYLQGKWYIYFSAGYGSEDYSDQRVWVLESQSADAMGSYTLKGKIAAPDDSWAIDGSVLEYNNEMYFIWSGEPSGGGQQDICIAKMSNPYTISTKKTVISRATYSWERRGNEINEGPTALTHNGKVYIIYSASGSWLDDYCLGQLTLTGTDPLNAAHWQKKSEPVFKTGNGLYGPGHASFVTAPDGKDWIVYHTARTQGSGWDRVVRMQPFSWNSNGPVFGSPDNQPVVLPEGEGNSIADGGLYKLRNRLGNYMLTVQGEELTAVADREDTAQLWRVEETSAGVVRLRSEKTGLYLALPDAALGTAPALGPTGTNTQWRLCFTGNEYLELYNANGKSLGSSGASGSGRALNSVKPGTSSAQWELLAASPAETPAPTPAPTVSSTPTQAVTETPAIIVTETPTQAVTESPVPVATVSAAVTQTLAPQPTVKAASGTAAPYLIGTGIVLIALGGLIFSLMNRKKHGS